MRACTSLTVGFARGYRGGRSGELSRVSCVDWREGRKCTERAAFNVFGAKSGKLEEEPIALADIIKGRPLLKLISTYRGSVELLEDLAFLEVHVDCFLGLGHCLLCAGVFLPL